MVEARNWVVAATFVLSATLGLGSAALVRAQGQALQAPTFQVDPLWPKPLPNHWLLGSAVGVAVDSRDHVFVLNLPNSFNARTEIGAAQTPPTGECCFPAPNVLEFDPEGNLVGHWGGPGEGFAWPSANNGIAIDPRDNLWIGGVGGSDTQVLKFAKNGRFVAQFGKPGVAPPPPPTAADTAYQGVAGGGRGAGGGAGGRGGRGGPPPLPANSASMESFGGAAAVSFDARTNEAFIADGSRNRRVAVVDINTGAIKRVWGAYGAKPDDAAPAAYTPGAPPSRQFSTVTCAELSVDGLVYVCDRQNNRIQVFRKNGTFVKERVIAPQTRGAGSVWDIAFSRDPQQRFLYVADGMNMKVHIVDRQSLEPVTAFGDGGRMPGQFFAVHSIATDSKGNIYTTETLEGKRVQKFLFKGLAPVTTKNQGVPRGEGGQ
jgi:sugar lactone lactonase YvrE